MKVSPLVLAAAIAGSAVAQQRSEYFPKCALDCLDQGTKKATDCSLDDAVCWCVQKNYENIYDASLACVLKDCGADKSVAEVLPAAIKFCSAATLSASQGSPSTEAASPTATPTEAGSTSAAPTSSGAIITSAPASDSSSGEITSKPTGSTETKSAAVSSTSSPAGAPASGPLGGFALAVLGALAAF